MKAKGSVTIFLSLALLLVIALVGSLLESARVTVAREVALDDSYLAVQNILAEYQREIWDDYHILFVDASELQGEEGAKKLGNSYLAKMMPSGRGDYLGTTTDFTEIDFKENLTENNCYYFAKQVSAYMKYGVAGSIGKKMLNNANILNAAENGTDALKKALKLKMETEKKLIELERQKKKLEEKTEDIKKIKDRVISEKKIQAFSKASLIGINTDMKDDEKKVKLMKKAEAEKKYKQCQKNLDSTTNDGAAEGLLGAFLPSGKRISKLKIKSTTWNEIQTTEKEKTNMIDKGLLILYAKEHFKNFLSPAKEKEKREALRYGIEYLIVGKDSDEANLSSIANRIFGIRTIVQYSYFLTRQDKVAEARAIAAAIAGALGLPATIEIIKMGILMGWSIDEARNEVKKILQGEEIPMFPGKAEGIKLKYDSFLDSFLLFAIANLPTRMVKLIEQNIKVRYYDGFRADNLFAGINGEVRVRVVPRIFRLSMLDGLVNKNVNHWESSIKLSQSLCRE